MSELGLFCQECLPVPANAGARNACQAPYNVGTKLVYPNPSNAGTRIALQIPTNAGARNVCQAQPKLELGLIAKAMHCKN